MSIETVRRRIVRRISAYFFLKTTNVLSKSLLVSIDVGALVRATAVFYHRKLLMLLLCELSHLGLRIRISQ